MTKTLNDDMYKQCGSLGSASCMCLGTERRVVRSRGRRDVGRRRRARRGTRARFCVCPRARSCVSRARSSFGRVFAKRNDDDDDVNQPAVHSMSSGKVTKSAVEIARKAAEIFGHHVGNGLPSGRKVLRKAMIGDKLVEYYPRSLVKMDPLMTDPDDTRRKVKLERLRRRGKGAPKKGEGKRATKGK